jgi:hypothetical protein
MSDQEFLHGAIHGSLLAVISKPPRGYWALLAAAWIWAIWSCAEYWRGNPNYSYGGIVPVLSLAYAARRLTRARSENIAHPILAVPIWIIFFLGIVAAAMFFGLEFARELGLHPIIVTWTLVGWLAEELCCARNCSRFCFSLRLFRGRLVSSSQ